MTSSWFFIRQLSTNWFLQIGRSLYFIRAHGWKLKSLLFSFSSSLLRLQKGMKIYTSPYIYVIFFDIPTNKIIASALEHISDKNVLSSAIWPITLTQSSKGINFAFWYSVLQQSQALRPRSTAFSKCVPHIYLWHIQGVQLKSGPYGTYFNISNLFTHFLLALAF